MHEGAREKKHAFGDHYPTHGTPSSDEASVVTPST